ncbi:replication protein A 70 kDa DNA-binding subunit B [Artemisia annua]|uniref:Replication protein A 70 kDa DNA-binding subunit B n=1 Tax=Artemisia annua TaxID=35608 RepID=A0A2U1L7G3_ARTAN|nr:replication protein A 70 kDa DNA-binding subunit B [Artemisia annua]
MMRFQKLMPSDREVASEEFFNGTIKKMVGSIRDSDTKFNCVVYAKIHKIHRERGWAYMACKKCGCVVKEVEKGHSSSSGSKFKMQQVWMCNKHSEVTANESHCPCIDDTVSASLLLFDDMILKLCGVQCNSLIKEYGTEVDYYFPGELNVMVGKKLLFHFEYTKFNINNNNYVQQVKLLSEKEAMINTFKKGFHHRVTSANTNKLTGDNIPFNMEETPTFAKGNQASSGDLGIQASGGDSGSSGSVKRTYIDIDDYPKEDDEAKKAKKIVQVKIEPKE